MPFLSNVCVMGSLDAVGSFSHLQPCCVVFRKGTKEPGPSGASWGFASLPCREGNESCLLGGGELWASLTARARGLIRQ